MQDLSVYHTPSPMGFLEDILERPKNERAFLLIPVGYPAKGHAGSKYQRNHLKKYVQ